MRFTFDGHYTKANPLCRSTVRALSSWIARTLEPSSSRDNNAMACHFGQNDPTNNKTKRQQAGEPPAAPHPPRVLFFFFSRECFSRERLRRVPFKNLLWYSSANHHHLIIISSSSSSHHHFTIIIIIFPLSLSLAFLFFSNLAQPSATPLRQSARRVSKTEGFLRFLNFWSNPLRESGCRVLKTGVFLQVLVCPVLFFLLAGQLVHVTWSCSFIIG